MRAPMPLADRFRQRQSRDFSARARSSRAAVDFLRRTRLRVAAIGWLISCASVDVMPPTRLKRAAWAICVFRTLQPRAAVPRAPCALPR